VQTCAVIYKEKKREEWKEKAVTVDYRGCVQRRHTALANPDAITLIGVPILPASQLILSAMNKSGSLSRLCKKSIIFH
jgi:hypothetical protein